MREHIFNKMYIIIINRNIYSELIKNNPVDIKSVNDLLEKMSDFEEYLKMNESSLIDTYKKYRVFQTERDKASNDVQNEIYKVMYNNIII